jgi:DNA excision repair protein ERCC-3
MEIIDDTRPLYISKDLSIFYESFSEFQIEDFLNVISEPKSRPLFIHEFVITEYSLTRAVLIGLNAEKILDDLQKFCKHVLPQKVVDFIGLKCSNNYVYLEVVDQKYFLRSAVEIIEQLRANDEIKQCIKPPGEVLVVPPEVISMPLNVFEKEDIVESDNLGLLEDIVESDNLGLLEFFEDDDFFDHIDPDEFLEDADKIPNPHNASLPNKTRLLPSKEGGQDQVDQPEIDLTKDLLEIIPNSLPTVKLVLSNLSYPLIEQYDYKNDSLAKLNIHLKSHAKLRAYQQSCLEKVFSGGMMRSGIIVLPCGSGKTLVGVTAGCTIQKSVLVLCNSSVSVEQWTREFKFWSDIDPNSISKFSSQAKECFTTPAGILVSTYTMVID